MEQVPAYRKEGGGGGGEQRRDRGEQRRDREEGQREGRGWGVRGGEDQDGGEKGR